MLVQIDNGWWVDPTEVVEVSVRANGGIDYTLNVVTTSGESRALSVRFVDEQNARTVADETAAIVNRALRDQSESSRRVNLPGMPWGTFGKQVVDSRDKIIMQCESDAAAAIVARCVNRSFEDES